MTSALLASGYSVKWSADAVKMTILTRPATLTLGRSHGESC
jgi:hypothetical protein